MGGHIAPVLAEAQGGESSEKRINHAPEYSHKNQPTTRKQASAVPNASTRCRSRKISSSEVGDT